MDRDEIFQRIDSTWQDLQGALHGIPAERASEPGVAGEWSVKDLIGHITFWERSCAAELQLLEPDDAIEDLDIDQLNARAHERIKSRSLRELQDDFAQTHEALMQALHDTENLDPDPVKGDTWEHYVEHTADIRNWRERVGI
jgi:Mycothiol maleylpyruvate isomerase N-terminal domain